VTGNGVGPGLPCARLHLDDDRLKSLTREQAIALVNEYWSRPDQG